MGEPIYGRPDLTKDLGSKRFLEFYYLETELSDFCKKNGLPFDGTKAELTERVAAFLSGGKKTEMGFVPKYHAAQGEIDSEMAIEPNFIYEDKHKRFFESEIGVEFVPFDDFLAWLESNSGKSYGEAVNIWFIIRDTLGVY